MKVCFVTDTLNHPLLSAAASLLRARHEVSAVNPGGDAPGQHGVADVYLLKAHTDEAIRLAAWAEARGARVINSASATRRCQDRVLMAERAHRASLPFPDTLVTGRLRSCRHEVAAVGFPLVVKSRRSRRSDLVTAVRSGAELESLVAEWRDEPVVVQRLVPNDGCDHKLWIFGSTVFYGVTQTRLDAPPGAEKPRPKLMPELPRTWWELAMRVAATFQLVVFGVDIIVTPRGPVIVDINAFPGARGMPGAPEALADLVEAPTVASHVHAPSESDRLVDYGAPR